MIKTGFVALAAVLALGACTGMGGERHGHGHGRGGTGTEGGNMANHMARYDANGDGMLTKEEFLRAHETMFDRMKNKDGVIDLKNMPMRRSGS